MLRKNNFNKEEIGENKIELSEIIIIGIIKIEKDNLKQRIINSCENVKREEPKWEWDKIKVVENEEEIKNCEIFINDKKIKFTYDYNFKNKGQYKIKYKFKNLMTSTNFMFYGCNSLISLDLSNFNTQNVTNMEYMFDGCSSLINLDLSNFNTQNVTNMRGMFHGRNSLENIDLSYFNTQNVINMEGMFYGCNSLKNIDLSNFNTQNVNNMEKMFFGCKSLKKEFVITKDKNILEKLK